MYLARNAVIAGYYADNDFTARIGGSGTPRSGFVRPHVECAGAGLIRRTEANAHRFDDLQT
jgi:hypothetical protein